MNKKKGTIYYLAFAVLTITAIIVYLKIDRERKKEHPQITELAVEPDLLINSADRYQHDHKRMTAIEFLEDAIAMMKLLEKDGDDVSMAAIETAIHDLEVVEEHIKADDINEDFMYEAFADAMNSLAYASLRISETYIKEGKNEEANVTLKHAMQHLENSIIYARGQQKDEEIKILAHLSKIIEDHHENDISQIEAVMAEIDSVVQAHVIN
jgi:hypothetical protein